MIQSTIETARYLFITACKSELWKSTHCLQWCKLEQDTGHVELCGCEVNFLSLIGFENCKPCVDELISCKDTKIDKDCPKKCFSVHTVFI
jgi:hypothetical protein